MNFRSSEHNKSNMPNVMPSTNYFQKKTEFKVSPNEIPKPMQTTEINISKFKENEQVSEKNRAKFTIEEIQKKTQERLSEFILIIKIKKLLFL